MADKQKNFIEQLLEAKLPTPVFLSGGIVLILAFLKIELNNVKITTEGSEPILAGIGLGLITASFLLYLKPLRNRAWLLPFGMFSLAFLGVYFFFKNPTFGSSIATLTPLPTIVFTETPSPTATSTATVVPTPEVTATIPPPQPCPMVVCLITPRSGEKVEDFIEVTWNGKPNAGEKFYVLVKYQDNNNRWLTDSPPAQNGALWRVSANIGNQGSQDKGKKYEICVISTDQDPYQDRIGDTNQLRTAGLPTSSASSCILVERK